MERTPWGRGRKSRMKTRGNSLRQEEGSMVKICAFESACLSLNPNYVSVSKSSDFPTNLGDINFYENINSMEARILSA
jgi:hypothetical protein